jgi:hypothetical protein
VPRSARLLAFAVAAVIHIAVFAPEIGSQSSIIDRGFWPQSERILGGEQPYRDVDFEYPPLALPLVVAPAAVSDGLDGYRHAFELLQLGFDLAILAVLAFCVAGPRRRIYESLAVYSLCVIAVSNVILWDSSIELAPLALARFDLAVALLLLGAVLARHARRSVLWGALLGGATAVKAFAVVLAPTLARGEKRLRPAAIGFAALLAVAAAIVVFGGDEFGSAIDYHSDRDLQIETVAATPFLAGHELWGAEAEVTTGGGSFNIDAPGAELARALSITLGLALIVLIILEGYRRELDPFAEATAILTAMIVFAPVLSPQFLLWVLPISAIAYGFGKENLALLAAFVLTQDMLHNYIGVETLDAPFVWSLAARNVVLLVYLGLVLWPILRAMPQHPPGSRSHPISPQGEARGDGG